MDTERKARYEARARIIKALAHPARLLIVDELRGKSRCVCELQAELELDMSTVSKHLSVLKNAGIVQDAKKGVQVYYSLRCPCVTDFFQCAEKVLLTRARDQAEVLGRTARGGLR